MLLRRPGAGFHCTPARRRPVGGGPAAQRVSRPRSSPPGRCVAAGGAAAGGVAATAVREPDQCDTGLRPRGPRCATARPGRPCPARARPVVGAGDGAGAGGRPVAGGMRWPPACSTACSADGRLGPAERHLRRPRHQGAGHHWTLIAPAGSSACRRRRLSTARCPRSP
ncbi:hypothetical protein HBB16_07780 [Pseudonocardia sp. MCCB 268]|nr:hypothetical protein [Pseudonocardia cytotoxica]